LAVVKNKRTYAACTSVTPGRSREEIDKMLRKYGATGFGYAEQDDNAAALMFTLSGRTYRYLVAMPKLSDFTHSSRFAYARNGQTQAKAAYELAVREKWRAIVATIKGKLIAVDTGIETFEEIFMARTVMTNGQVVADYIEPELKRMYATGQVPKLFGPSPNSPKSLTGEVI
jgi:hypothetical protein